MKKLKIYLFVQDECIICNNIKKEYDLEILSKSSIQDIPIYKIYPQKKQIDYFDLTHVPTIAIISYNSKFPNVELIEYMEQGFVSKTNLAEYLNQIKKGNILRTPIAK